MLSRLTDEVVSSSIMEDLEYRFFVHKKEKGLAAAIVGHVYHSNVIVLSLAAENIVGGFAMLRSYLKIALRNLRKRKVYSFINITGLGMGVAVCMLIFLFVEYELGFDSHFSHRDRLYRVVTHTQRAGETEYERGTPFPTGEALREDFAELKTAARLYRESDVLIGAGAERFREDRILFAEPQFFDMFDTEWIAGDASNALNDPDGVVLTERLADKYFGGTEALGSTLRWNNEIDLRVTGVVANLPARTSLPYDMLISWGVLDTRWGSHYLKKWDLLDNDCHAFVLLPESADPVVLEERFYAFEQKYMTPEYAEAWSFRLQPLSDIHFNPRYGSYNYITSRRTLFVFSTVGLLILVIACINFINLTTAQAMMRAREVGVRKVLGADRTRLIRQLLGETSLFTFFSILTAVFLTWGALPYLNRFLGHNTVLRLFPTIGLPLFLVGVYLFVSILNGLYPAFMLSRYRPAEALKQKPTGGLKRSYALRNSLVLLQFVISQILIVGTLVIAGQTRFMSRMDPGFRKEGILIVPIPEYEETRCEALRSRWLGNPRIREVSFAWSAPTSRSNFSTPFVYEASGSITECPVSVKMCDKRYLDVYDIPLVAGKFFERNVGDESHIRWVVNEAVVGRMGLSDPYEAVGKRVTVNELQGDIIGVLRDFHVYSLRHEIQLTVFFNFWPRHHREAQIRMTMDDAHATIDHIRQVWMAYYPEYLFEYAFLDDFLRDLYEGESKLLTMIQGAAFLAIFIGCLGLLGLVSFMVLQRTKEIGIRKVLGASAGSIYVIISREFLKWVAVASLVAWPIVYVLTTRWLEEFAYRISMDVGFFLLGGLISLGIAAIVVSYQVMRAAMADPVESLRYE
jgi:predicted permease